MVQGEGEVNLEHVIRRPKTQSEKFAMKLSEDFSDIFLFSSPHAYLMY